MAQELYIPSMDGIIQTVNTSLGNVFLDNRDASFNNVDISGTLNASNSNNAIKYSSHLIPTSNDTFDIGSAEYKVRDLYVADNSIFIGDKSKLGIDETGGLIIMERDSEIIPSGIYDGVTKIEEPANVLNDVNNKLGTYFTVLSEIKLEDWQKFSNILTTNANIPQKNMNQIYKPTTRNDWKSQKKIANLLNEYSDASFGNIDFSGGFKIIESDLTGANKITASSAITGGSLTDGTATLNLGALSGITDLSLSGTIKGPSIMTIDPAGHGDETGTLIIAGNLTVQGTTTTINSTTVDISDNRIRLNAAEASTDAGIDISFTDGTSKQFIYSKTDSEWKTNDTSLNIGTGDFTGKNIKISNKVIFYSD